MRNLRIIRVLVSTLFFAASVGCLAIGLTEHPLARLAESSQVIPSLLAGTLGASLFWLVVTIVFGRLYCSSVCPIGTLQDLILPLRKHISVFPSTFRYKKGRRIRHHILVIYVISVIAGLGIVPLLLEPWNLMRTICSIPRPDSVPPQWVALGLGTLTGILAGAVSLLTLTIVTIYFGRDFCNVVCPLGTAMSLLDSRNVYHIEINPDKCVGCLRCEEECKCSCIKVTGHYIDNSRCVRCFDCLAVCDEGAITYRRGRHRPKSPLMRRAKST